MNEKVIMDNMKVLYNRILRILYITTTVSSIPILIEIWNGNIFQEDSINVANLTYTLLCSMLIAFICLTIGVLWAARFER